MATAQQLLAIEAKEIGYSRWKDPQAGTKYGRWYGNLVKQPWFGSNGVAFCAMGQSWAFAQAGMDVRNIGLPTAGCGTIRDTARRNGKTVNRRSARPGDIVLFRWDGKINDMSYSDHVGMVEVNKGNAGIQTIEFNTGNGMVLRRARPWGVVQLIIRPDYDNVPSSGSSQTTSQSNGKIAEDGIWGKATTTRLQQVLKMPFAPDGVISNQNPAHRKIHRGCSTGWEYSNKCEGSRTIAEMQRRMGISVDGLCGPNTINALIKRYKASSGATAYDGVISNPSITVKAMQRALNNGKF